MTRPTAARRWWRCTNVDCAVMWGGAADVSCWACGAASARAYGPYLTSQVGYVPYDGQAAGDVSGV